MIKRRGLISDIDRHDIEGMLSRIRHRGPDDTGVCGICNNILENRDQVFNIENNAIGILGFNRLSIQDLSYAGHQPMLTEDESIAITFNGEIYNVEELKKKLRDDGYNKPFRGHSDTEVILRFYSIYGIDETLQIANGMFAIVIADIKKRALFIARDRIGIIPCHIIIDSNKIVWASEIKSFLELSSFDREISNDGLSDAIKYCYPNSSLYKNAESVEPGTYYAYQWDCDEICKTQYYSLLGYDKHKKTIEVEECESILKDCLQRQLISDAPLGVQLSGGVDSTLLAKYASDIYSQNKKNLCSFSLINKLYEQYNEEKWIDHAVRELNINVHKYDFDDETFTKYFEKSLYSFERFVNNPSPIGIYKFSLEAKQDVTVLISGEGADELAGGYSSFISAKKYGMYEKIAGQKMLTKYGEYYPQTSNYKFVSNFDSMLTDDKCRYIYPLFNIEKTVQNRKSCIDSMPGSSFEKMRLLYFKEELVSLLERQNKVCMANSIENRVPFLDNRFIDTLFTINENQLIRPMLGRVFLSGRRSNLYEGKYILKQISAGQFGKEFAYRKKQAFRAPIYAYIYNKRFQTYLNELIIPGMRKRGLTDMRKFDEAYSNIKDASCFTVVWKAINLEAWVQLFYDGRQAIEV